MALLTQRIARGLLPALDPDRAPALRKRPEKIILGVRPGHRPSGKPPVRIYLGTERNQFRAERVFLWSVDKHRDPGRIYEIYLLKELRGFRRRFWLTGFTNYRFAIPMFAGFQGRALYNDTDQVYLTDPAELFDQPMHGAGFLSINDRDTSVMLIDCARMQPVWNEHTVYRESRKQLEARARGAGLWGMMDGRWNARDKEYVPGHSACVHFTTLHTQPWRPFPDQFVYFDNPTGSLWPELEAEADRARFMPVSATRPSPAWPDTALALSARRDGPELQALLAPSPPAEVQPERDVRHLLERIPDADLGWLLARLFETSRHLTLHLNEPRSSRPGRLRRNLHFWLQLLEQTGRRHPATRWTLVRHGVWRSRRFHGGPAADGDILCLTHGKPGHNHQAAAVAQRLAQVTGRGLREVSLPFGAAGYLLARLTGRTPPGLDTHAVRVIVAAGWLPTRVARWLARGERDLRLVLMGRKAGPVPEHGAMVIGCRHFGLPPHPNRITTVLPLNAGHTLAAGAAGQRWAEWLAAPRRLAVLLGGTSRSHVLDDDTARRLGQVAAKQAEDSGAALLIVGSRRSGAALESVRAAAGQDAHVYAWRAADDDNPYQAALTHAHHLIVTGESESMLADAVYAGRPLSILPLPRRQPGPWRRFADAVAERAVRPRVNRRGSIRPQQGLTYLAARALERAWILPRRDVEALHQALYELKRAAPCAQPPPDGRRDFNELDGVVRQIAGTLLKNAPAEQPEHHEDQSHG